MTLFRKQEHFEANGFGKRIDKRAFLMFNVYLLFSVETRVCLQVLFSLHILNSYGAFNLIVLN